MAVHPGAVGANGAAAVLTAPRKVDEHLDKTVIAIAGTPGLPKEGRPTLAQERYATEHAAAEYAATQHVGALGPKSRARALCYRASNP